MVFVGPKLRKPNKNNGVVCVENTIRIIYSISKCINILMQEMEYEDAMEYFYNNVSGSYVGKQTPIWCADDM